VNLITNCKWKHSVASEVHGIFSYIFIVYLIYIIKAHTY